MGLDIFSGGSRLMRTGILGTVKLDKRLDPHSSLTRSSQGSESTLERAQITQPKLHGGQ